MDLLEEAGMLGCKPFDFDTPIDPNSKLGLDDEEVFSNGGCYRIMVGKLIYLLVTRLDITF